MPRQPKYSKEEWVEMGYGIAVIVGKEIRTDAATGREGHIYGDFHKMDAGCWSFGDKGLSHIIPITDEAGAMESYREHGGASPCEKCFPKSRKVKDGDSRTS